MAPQAPACGAVCPIRPLVCIVPAAASQVSMVGQQPMQMQMGMMMVAPMAAPVMMPLQDFSMHSAAFGATPPDFGDFSYSWSADSSSWPAYFSEELSTEESGAHVDFDFRAEGEPCEVEVPEQVQMDSVMQQPETTMERQRSTVTAAKAGTLRLRRGQECATQLQHSTAVTGFPHGEVDQDATVEVEAAEARELANRVLVQMQAGGDAQLAAVSTFERLAFTSRMTSLAAQIVLEEAPTQNDKLVLATALRGHVRSAVHSKHANHVLQKITEVMPVASASFIVDELKGFAYEVARHTFGCRVLCRILEHLSSEDSSTIELVEEVFVDLEELCGHSFGSYVARHLLEFGLPQHKQRVVSAIRTDLSGYTRHKFGSHVVEAALRHASAEDQQVLVRELLGDKEQLMSLAGNQFGRHVVKALLAVPSGLKQEALSVLRPMEDKLKQSRYGKSVWQAVRGALSA